jgi:hypothetical protein
VNYIILFAPSNPAIDGSSSLLAFPFHQDKHIIIVSVENNKDDAQ